MTSSGITEVWIENFSVDEWMDEKMAFVRKEREEHSGWSWPRSEEIDIAVGEGRRIEGGGEKKYRA